MQLLQASTSSRNIEEQLQELRKVASWLIVDSHGMINATRLAEKLETTTQAYEKNGKNQRFIKSLKLKLGREVVLDGDREGAGRKYHARVALDLARWASPELSVELNGILMDFITGNLTSEDSATAARALQQVS